MKKGKGRKGGREFSTPIFPLSLSILRFKIGQKR
jgi:hypothetical protein